jgi:hypothetical protein
MNGPAGNPSENEAPSNASVRSVDGFGEVLAGIALGLFVGLLLGLSVTSGTTSTVITALVAILATFFGFSNTLPASSNRPANYRIAAFCLAGVIATPAAIYVRSHNLLSPQSRYFSDLATELRELQYSEDDIREMIKIKYFSPASVGNPLPSPTPEHGSVIFKERSPKQ